jgi:hypothetical protein
MRSRRLRGAEDRSSLRSARAGRWRYLRYPHFREAIASVADQIEGVCILARV